MTLSEVVYAFEATYKLECLKKQQKQIAIEKPMEALWVSEAMQDITQRVKEGLNIFSPTPVTGQTVYALPSDFSMLKSAGYPANTTSGQIRVNFDILDVQDIIIQPPLAQSGATVGMVSQCAITSVNSVWYINFDAVPNGSEVITYYTTTMLYSPSWSTAGQVTGVSIYTSGTGYIQGDLLTLSGGGANCVLQVTSVSEYIGNVLGVMISVAGTGYSIASAVSVTGGAGTGFKANITSINPTYQNWGAFDGKSFSGNFNLRDAYFPAVREYMLSRIFDERVPLYEAAVEKLRQNQSTTTSQLTYNYGGVSI